MTPNELEAYDAMIADRDRWKERTERLESLYPSGAVPCSASFRIFEAQDVALCALSKRELIRLLTLVGIPPVRSIDRQRVLMAKRLAKYADNVTIYVQWDSRMPEKSLPNAKAQAPQPEPLNL